MPRRRWPGRHGKTLVARVGAFAVALLTALALTALVACDGGADNEPSPPRQVGAGDRNLQGVCPRKVVVQSNWYPTVDTAAAWSLVGPGYRIDTDKKRITGPLVAHGVDTGIDIDVRAGGPAIGFQQVSAQMYADTSITLGYVITDEAIAYAAKQPTLSVLATLEIDPQVLIWDPATYPQFNTIGDIGLTDVKVLYYSGAVYMDYLVGSGILRRSQVDGSYDGSPATFVADGGKTVVQGYATNEPYTYQHEVPAWGKPVQYALIYDTGYPNYANTLAIRRADKDRLAPCLARLVPILQQAQVDFLTAPGPAIDLIVELDRAFDFNYSRGNADYGARTLLREGLAGNGADQTLGNFDAARLQRLIDIVHPILRTQGKEPKEGLRPADLATDEFIDRSIGLRSVDR
jgi:hypothetical protein